MVQIVGTYKHVSHSPSFATYLKDIGVSETSVPIMINMKPTLTVSEDNGQWTFHNTDGGKEWSSTFKLGEPYDAKRISGDVLKSVTKREGDKFITESTVDGVTDTRTYEFTDTGITLTLSHPKSSGGATSVFERV